jgi:probable rRNA maturation factor
MPEVRVADPGAASPCAAEEVERWVTAVLAGEGQEHGTVSVTFLSGDDMRELNRQALGRDGATDVIAFRLDDPQGLVGDVYLCPSVAAVNAAAADVPAAQEVLRLVIHGTLHVLGHDHPDDGPERLASPMWAKQEAYVRRLWDSVLA